MNAIDPEVKTVMSAIGQRARRAAGILAFAATDAKNLALTAAAALVSVPQATTGTAMRSASSPVMRVGISTITSTSSRSAPRPARSVARAISTDGA